MSKNPARNYAIEWVNGKVVTETDVAAIAAAAVLAGPPDTGDPIGDVVDTDLPLLETLPTEETDTELVPHPDGLGGVAWGSAGAGGMVPYYIPVDETFTVPLYRQALFSEAIEVDGGLVVNGLLLGVD